MRPGPYKHIVKEQENIQLYRFDSRTLEQIQADGGFKPQQHSIFYDDILNLKNGSVGVSFTTDKQVAVAYMLKRVKKGLTDGALYTVKLSAEEAAMAFSLSKTAKARGDSDLWLHLKKGTVSVTEDNGEKSRRSKGEVNIVPTLGAIAVSDKSIIAVEPTKEYLHAHPKLHLESSNGNSSDHFRKKLADGKLNPQPSSLSKAQKEDDNEDKKKPPSATR